MARLVISIGAKNNVEEEDFQHIDLNPPKTPQPNNQIKKEQGRNNNNGRRIALAYAMQVGNEAISYVGSNLGKWTGDSRYQQAFDLGSKAMGIAMGFAINPVVGGVNLAIQATKYALDVTQQRKDEQIRNNFNRAMQGYAFGESIFASRRH